MSLCRHNPIFFIDSQLKVAHFIVWRKTIIFKIRFFLYDFNFFQALMAFKFWIILSKIRVKTGVETILQVFVTYKILLLRKMSFFENERCFRVGGIRNKATVRYIEANIAPRPQTKTHH